MRRMLIILAIILITAAAQGRFCLVADSTLSVAVPEKNDSTSSTSTIRCSGRPVGVILDSAPIGITPIINYPVAAGEHVLHTIPADTDVWQAPMRAETLHVGHIDHLERTIVPPAVLTIHSDPFGAEIYTGDSLLGTTPAQIVLPASGSLRLSKSGYRTLYLPLTGGENIVTSVLEPLEPGKEIEQRFLKKSSTIPASFYMTTGAAVLSGTAAVYFKISADKLYREYQQSGDGITLRQVERLDVAAGISLAISEISIFMLYSILISQ